MLSFNKITLEPFIILYTSGNPGDSLILKKLISSNNGTISVQDGRKSYSSESNLIIPCTQLIIEGGSIFKQIKKYAGDGGWFFMPEDIFDEPITCEVDTTFITIDHVDKIFIENRTIHNLNLSETVTILPSIEKQKYIYVAKGSLIINDNIESSAPMLLKINNPATIISNDQSIFMELEV